MLPLGWVVSPRILIWVLVNSDSSSAFIAHSLPLHSTVDVPRSLMLQKRDRSNFDVMIFQIECSKKYSYNEIS